MDSMTFLQPVYVGDLVLLHARVTWVGTTSLETEVSIEAEELVSGERRHTSTAYFVFVALDEHGRKHPMPPLELSGDEEHQRWRAAEERRAYRLAQRAVGRS
jgi:acyl-CoA hydrolase